MSDWCPENDGAYQAEMAERFRRNEITRLRAERDAAYRRGMERAAEIAEGFADNMRCAKCGRALSDHNARHPFQPGISDPTSIPAAIRKEMGE